jgi:hypothetical protein
MVEVHPIWAMRTHNRADNSFGMDTPPVHHLYQIRVRGTLGDTLVDAFPTLHASVSEGHTILSGDIADQAALHGVLSLIESLGLELVAVQQLSP